MATKPSTFIIKTVRGVRRQILQYDADVFNEKIRLSASLIIKDIKEIGLYDIPFDSEAVSEYGVTHYNTTHKAEIPVISTESVDGGYTLYNSKHTQNIDDISITVYPKPQTTLIKGNKRVDKNSQYTYHIDKDYGSDDFTYNWDIDGASFQGSNIGTKEVVVSFGGEERKVVLICKITNGAGCYRIIKKNIYIGLIYKDLLVVRNTYL
jgi:hypothetical protein